MHGTAGSTSPPELGQAPGIKTARDLLECIDEYVTEKSGDEPSPDRLRAIAQRFDVAPGEALLDRTSMPNEG